MLKEEMRAHLIDTLIPFWKGLRDNDNGGYIGEVSYDLKVLPKAEKGCILNSRILWFFANAYTLLKDESLLDEARHAYNFLIEHFLDTENSGLYWSVSFNGVPSDTSKHTYNQAFAIYALSSYYEASGDCEALKLAFDLFLLIEEKCTDEFGYKDSFNEFFNETLNDKLSENGVIAEKTMNTILHLLEAYTELYRVSPNNEVKYRIEWILSFFAEKIYNPRLSRLEVFFDTEMNSIIDIHSYGHDIEAAWLIDRAVQVINNCSYFIRMNPITAALTNEVYNQAFDGSSLSYESEEGIINENRIWWVQAEALVGFLHGYKREPHRSEYKEAVQNLWQYIKDYLIDKRKNSEWYAIIEKNGNIIPDIPIADQWKCPYHNGRMCFEVLKTVNT